MPVPATIADLDTDESLNSPNDSETITPSTRPSDYIRALGAIIKQFAEDTGLSGGFLQAGTGAVARTANAKLRDVVNVKDFGATGDNATDDAAAIQKAYDAVSTGGEVHWTNDGYKISTPISITKAVKTFFNGATVTQTGLGNAFTMSTANQTSASFSLVFRGGRLVGNAKSAGSCGISVSSNNPFVYVEDMHINGWDIGIKLADAYCSQISNSKCISNNVGIELQSECHASTVTNAFCESNTTAGLRLNYGGGFTDCHNLTIVGGAFQNSVTGIWIEEAYEPSILNPYFEGNTNTDLRLGVADAGYARSVYSGFVTGFQSNSPCSTGANNTNIVIEYSVGIEIRGAGFYAATPTKHVSVDGGSDRVLVDYWKTTIASPWSFPTGNDAYRCTLSQHGRMQMPYDALGTAKHLNWKDASGTQYASIYFGDGISSRPSLIIQQQGTSGDILFKAPAGTGQIRFADDSNNEFMSVDPLNGRVNAYVPFVMKEYTVATLPASGAYSRAFVTDANATTFGSVVAGGGANKVPVFHDGTDWRIG